MLDPPDVAELRKHSPKVLAILIVADSNPAWQLMLDPLIDLVRPATLPFRAALPI